MTRREALQRAVTLSGMVLTPPMAVLLEGCQPRSESSWEPQWLTRRQVDLVGKIADRILPSTDTLGALDVGVDRFIDVALGALFTSEERQRFLRQLDDFLQQDEVFVGGTEAVQNEQLLLLEQTHAQARKADPHAPVPFFRIIRQLTLLGYFTSEAVMNNQLNYHAVPGKYTGCVPLATSPRLYVDNNV